MIKINLKEYNKKTSLLKRLSEIIPDMFGLNYDALIDSATFYNEPLCIEFENIDFFEDKQNLLEVLEIISTENSKFTYRV